MQESVHECAAGGNAAHDSAAPANLQAMPAVDMVPASKFKLPRIAVIPKLSLAKPLPSATPAPRSVRFRLDAQAPVPSIAISQKVIGLRAASLQPAASMSSASTATSEDMRDESSAADAAGSSQDMHSDTGGICEGLSQMCDAQLVTQGYSADTSTEATDIKMALLGTIPWVDTRSDCKETAQAPGSINPGNAPASQNGDAQQLPEQQGGASKIKEIRQRIVLADLQFAYAGYLARKGQQYAADDNDT